MKLSTHILPSLITVANLLCGFFAIMIGDVKIGIFLIVIGAIADVFDGLVARILHSESEMGKELDSLADIVTFGAAPAYLYYLLAPKDNYIHMIPPALYVAGGALRLAKFNTLPASKYFRGLPIPAAAMFMVGFLNAVLKESDIALKIMEDSALYALIPAALGILMNTGITMFSFKSLEKDIKNNFFPVLLVVLMILFFLIDHRLAIPLTVIFYIILSILSGFVSKIKKT